MLRFAITVSKRWTHRMGLAVALVPACTADATPIVEAEVAEVCGQPGPVQILPLERDEVVPERWPVVMHGDRYLYGIRRFDHAITNLDYARLDREQRMYAELDARVESIDRCGDDRRVIAEGVDVVIPPPNDGEPWLGYRTETNTLFWIDPDGAWAPREVARTTQPWDHLASGELVYTFDREAQELVQWRLADDEVRVGSRLESVIDVGPLVDLGVFGRARTEETIALQSDGELVAIRLATAEVVSVASNVGGFVANSDPRYVAWWAGVPDDPFAGPPTQLLLSDREGPGSLYLDFGGVPLDMTMGDRLAATEHVAVDVGGYSAASETTLTLLPELASVTLAGSWRPFGVADGNRVSVLAPFDTTASTQFVFEARDGELQQVAGPIANPTPYDGALWWSECAGGPTSEHGAACDLMTMRLATLQPEVVARDAWSDVALPGGRWVVFHAPEPDPDAWRPDPRGTLWVIDGSTGEESRLAIDVSSRFELHEPHDDTPDVWHTEEVVYQVRSLDTDDTGLWRVRFD